MFDGQHFNWSIPSRFSFQNLTLQKYARKGKQPEGITIYAKQPLQVGLYANHPSGLMLKQLSDPPTNPPDSQIWKTHDWVVATHFFGGIFTPILVEMIQFDYTIFFKWVETTN